MSADGGGVVVRLWRNCGGWGTGTLAAWSALMLVLWATGRLDLYLHPGFRPLVGAAGVLLAVMVAGLCFLPRETTPENGAEESGGFLRNLPGLAVLVIPAYAAAILGPQGYSLSTIMNRGISMDGSLVQGTGGGMKSVEDLPLPAQGEYSPAMAGVDAGGGLEDEGTGEDVSDFFQFIEKSPRGAWRLEMLDLVYAAQTHKLRKKLEDEKVELTGQVVTKAPGATAEQFCLVRLLMVCCAADARPLGVWVRRQAGIAGFQEMDWVRITGRPTFPVRDGRRVVVIEIEEMVGTDPPDEMFLFQ